MLPELVRDLLERPALRRAGVVDQHVDAAHARHGLLVGPHAVRRRADVGRDRDHLDAAAARRRHARLGLLQHLRPARDERHAGPRLRERLADGEADAETAACDQRLAALHSELHGDVLLPWGLGGDRLVGCRTLPDRDAIRALSLFGSPMPDAPATALPRTLRPPPRRAPAPRHQERSPLTPGELPRVPDPMSALDGERRAKGARRLPRGDPPASPGSARGSRQFDLGSCSGLIETVPNRLIKTLNPSSLAQWPGAIRLSFSDSSKSEATRSISGGGVTTRWKLRRSPYKYQNRSLQPALESLRR